MNGPADVQRIAVHVTGLVQGVGFRPFVYGLARRLGLSGWARNDADGVWIEVQGAPTALEAFITTLRREPPSLARVDGVAVTPLRPPPFEESADFVIAPSRSGGPIRASVTPDIAPCPDCLREMFDPTNRRWRHAFISCTQCGPRHSITARLPYDRPNTSLAGFPLCPACAAEYHDPSDRRHHAQPIACLDCGPTLSRSVEEAWAVIAAGGIVALKGVGGFQLLCDARRPEVVERLREAKQRDGKPFAVMTLNSADAAQLVALTPQEREVLESRARPIVLARRAAPLPPKAPRTWDPRASRPWRGEPEGAAEAPSVAQRNVSKSAARWEGDVALPDPPSARDCVPGPPPLADAVAPGLAWLGVCLPSSPLHYLLFHTALGAPEDAAWLEQPCGLALVCTSANPGGEPLCIDDADAARRLDGIADLILGHDRPILIRADDSVARVIAGAPRLYRRGRGHTPDPIPLPIDCPPILALGGELKNTVCALRGREAFLSQHVGGLSDAATRRFQQETVAHLLSVLAVEPALIACDAHPDSPATRFAEQLAAERDLPLRRIQHHAAHLYAVAAEHGIAEPLLGLALDGFGYGDDGGAWGGELMVVGPAGWRRLGSLAPLPLPGGDKAAREPWRMAAAALHHLGRGSEIAARWPEHPLAAALAAMLAAGRAPLTSSLGRWFDAASGLLDVAPVAGYEGEAPMRLESLAATPQILAAGWRIAGDQLDLTPLLARLTELRAEPAFGAALFHGTVAAALVDWAAASALALGTTRVALNGGCMMNGVLAEALIAGLTARGLTPLLARRAPANDGGLALGQAWGAALIRSLGGDRQPFVSTDASGDHGRDARAQ